MATPAIIVSCPGDIQLGETLGIVAQCDLAGVPTDADIAVSFEISTMGQIVVQSGTILQIGGHARDGLYSGGVTVSTGNGFVEGASYYIRITTTVGLVSAVGLASFIVRTIDDVDVADAVWGATIPDWVPGEPLTYAQWIAFLRALQFYLATQTGSIGTIADRAGTTVATYQMNSTDITGYRSQPSVPT